MINVRLDLKPRVLARLFNMTEIANDQLVVELIPDPETSLLGWERFAHTINGYAVMGGFRPCADLADSGTASTLTELRCAFF